MPTNDLITTMAEADLVLEQILYKPGRIGRLETDGTYTMDVPNRPNWVYVRLGAGETAGVIEAYNYHAPMKNHLRVIVRKELNGDHVIHGLDQQGGLLAVDDYNVGFHQHGKGSGLEWIVPGLMMEAGRVDYSDGYEVAVASFRYKDSGVWNTFMGGTLDLTALVPGTAGAWAWVVVGLDPATNTLVAEAGDAQAYATPLTLDQIDDVDLGDAIPLAAIKVRNDDADLSDYTRYFDAHGWFNQDGGSGATSFTDLDDVPASYSGQAGKVVAVNGAENALEFIDSPPTAWGDITGTPGEITALAGLTSAADKLFYFSAADTGALADFTAFGRSLVDDANDAAARVTLGLVIGTNVQAYDAELAAIAGLTSAADRLPYFTGLGTAALATFTAFGRSLVDDANDAAARTTLGLGTIATEAETAYALLAGRSGGQTLKGGTASGNDLILESTNHATKGEVVLQPNGGNVYIGTDTPGATASNVYVERDGGFCALHLVSYRTSASGARNTFNGYAASGSKSSPAALSAGQPIFRLTGWAYDGSAFHETAMIEIVPDLNHGASDVPGRIMFYTTPDGSTTLAEAMRIDSNQRLALGATSAAARAHIREAALGNEVMRLESVATNDDVSERVYQARTTTTNNTLTTIFTYTIPASTVVFLDIHTVARRTGGSGGTAEDGAAYHTILAYNLIAGTATQIAGTSGGSILESNSAWGVGVSISGADVSFQVRGDTNNNVTWHSTIRVYQVSS